MILEPNAVSVTALTKKISEMQTRVDEVDEKVKSDGTGGASLSLQPIPTFHEATVGGYGPAFGNGLFVAIGYGNRKAYYSTDLVTWQETTFPFQTSTMMLLNYGNDKFLAVEFSGQRTAYSNDGITWVEGTTLSTPVKCDKLSFCGGKFILLNPLGTQIFYSDDGIVWHETALPRDRYYSVAHGNGLFIVAGSYEKARSSDLINWTVQANEDDMTHNIFFGDGKFIIFNSEDSTIYTSTDGIEWTVFKDALPCLNADWKMGLYGGGKFLIISLETIVESSDGETWNEIPNDGKTLEAILTHANGEFIIRTVEGLLHIPTTPQELTPLQTIVHVSHPIGSSMFIDKDPKTLPHFDFTTWELVETGKWKRTV